MADLEKLSNHPFDGHVHHLKQIIPESERIFSLLKDVEWYPFPLRKGKNSRRTFCNHSIDTTLVGKGLSNWLVDLFKQINVDVSVIGMFGNYYPDGESTLPHHRDQYNSDVISLSFGAKRLFNFKSDETKRVIKPSFYLSSGDIIMFDQHTNERCTHGIPAQKQIKDIRINVTCFVKFLSGDPFTSNFESVKIPAINIPQENDEDLANRLQILELSS